MPVYEKLDPTWKPQPCPSCGREATGHAYLFGEAPPTQGPDVRTMVGESYQHRDGEECQRLSKEYQRRHGTKPESA